MSKFGFDSIGTVANNKLYDTNKIKVFPIEHLAEYDGNITDEDDRTKKDGNVIKKKQSGNVSNSDNSKNKKTNTKTNVVDSGNKKSAGNADKKMYVEAEWIDLGGSNRKTAPDVKKGETVVLYRFGDANRWFWSSLQYESDLRRKESVLHIYGNTDEHGVTLDNTNSYFTLMDTVNKLIHIHTSDNDGEVTTFDIKLNTKEGYLEVIDGNGNFIKHDGKNGILDLKYNKDINLTAGNDINLKAGNNISKLASKDIKGVSGRDTTQHANRDLGHSATENMRTDTNGGWDIKTKRRIRAITEKNIDIKAHEDIKVESDDDINIRTYKKMDITVSDDFTITTPTLRLLGDLRTNKDIYDRLGLLTQHGDSRHNQ